MKGRLTAMGIATVVCVALLAPGVATASARTAHPAKFCAKAHASLPRHALVGDAITIGSGIANCDTESAKLVLVFKFDGPCDTREHRRDRYTLDPGSGLAFAESFVVPCPGKYRLLVEAYFGASLLDRKARRMRVPGA
jgi:hypothetical protein